MRRITSLRKLSPTHILSLSPVQIMVLSGVFVEAVAVGAEHCLALTSAGEVWGWGNNSDNQLGLGHTTPIVRQPQPISTLTARNIRQVSTLLSS